MKNQIPIICIAGPTASGKTALALELAAHINIEIISVDSALIYKQMNIGTAKPSQKEQQAVKHHLIDTHEPNQSSSAAEFIKNAKDAINQIKTKNKIPVLTGGTMLYYKTLIEGINEIPSTNKQVRENINKIIKEEGLEKAYQKLSQIDPQTAARLHKTDAQRIGRALEVWEITGKPLSQYHQDKKTDNQLGKIHFYALEPQERSWLHNRINQRFEQMLKDGFLDEIKTLRARGDLNLDMPSIRSVGYRQAWQIMDTEGENLNQTQIQKLKETASAATRQLAKRQLTWLRGFQNKTPLIINEKTKIPELAKQITEQIKKD